MDKIGNDNKLDISLSVLFWVSLSTIIIPEGIVWYFQTIFGAWTIFRQVLLGY